MATLRSNTPFWGNPMIHNPGSYGTALNAAATWVGIGFTATASKTLNKVKIYCTSNGAPVAADYRLEVYSSATGNAMPNASLATATAPASVANGVLIEWTGLSLALTQNTHYYLVTKNLNGTPATNFYTPAGSVAVIPIQNLVGDYANGWGWNTVRTTNSGGTWNANSQAPSGIRLEFSDGSFAGFPLVPGTTTQQVYSTRESGAYFTSPDVDLVVVGVSMPLSRSGTPTGAVRYRIYQDINPSTRTLLGTTGSPPAFPTGGTHCTLFFPTPILLPAALPTRVVLSETANADASTNRYQHLTYSVENDADSIALCGNFKGTLSTDGGSTFAETDTVLVPFALILGPDETGSSDGVVVPRRGLNNLLRYRRGHLT